MSLSRVRIEREGRREKETRWGGGEGGGERERHAQTDRRPTFTPTDKHRQTESERASESERVSE